MFESSEEPLRRIGCGRDTWMLEVSEHVGQRLREHRARRSEISGDPGARGGLSDLLTVAPFPPIQLSQEVASCLPCGDVRHLGEQVPQPSSLGSLGVGAAPPLPLPLDVHQTPLDNHVGPDRVKHLLQLGIPVDGGAEWLQAASLQIPADIDHRPFPFPHAIDPGDDIVGDPIDEHHRPHTAPIQERPIDDHAAMTRQIVRDIRRPIQPVVDHLLQFPRAQTALLAQLADTVSLAYPSPKPDLTARPLLRTRPCDVPTTTQATAPPLTPTGGVSIASHVQTATRRAPLFDSCSFTR